MTARLVESHVIAPEVRHFTFEIPELDTFPFQAGQFVSFTHEINGRKITRAYSTAAPPSGNRFELCLNVVKEGLFSPHLFSMRPGETVEIKGPYGVFVWRTSGRDCILVATGTGIAPFRGMLQERLPHERERRFTLIFGVRYEASILYRQEFEALAAEHRNFTFQPTLSRPGEDWPGLRGHVQPHVLAAIGDRRDIDIYICGLKAMVDDLRARLKEQGFDRKQIIFEKYD